MLNNFIYAKTKDLFLERLTAGDILDEAIVFIEDTKEIWNHGTYFAGAGIADNSNFLPLSGGTIKGRLTITTESGTDYTDINVVRNGIMAYMGIQGTQGALFGYVGASGDAKGLIIDSSGLLYDDNNTQYNILHSGNISNYAATRSYLIYTNITVPSAGWYKIASINDGMRGMVKFHIRTDGGNYTPNDTEFTIDLGWTYNTKDRFLKMSGGYGYVSAARVSSGAIELYFTSAVTSNQMLYVPCSEYCGAYQNNSVGWFSGELPKGSTDGAPNYVEKSFYGESIAGALYINGYEAIHSGNIGSYITGGGQSALLTTGGTMTGTLYTDATPGIILRRAEGVPYLRFTHTDNTSYGEIGVNTDGYPVFWPARFSNDAWKRMFFEGSDIVSAAGGVFIHRSNEINCFNGNLFLNHRGDGSDSNGKTGHVVMCTNGGNVLIGTSTDNGDKLRVSGSASFGSSSLVKIGNHIYLGKQSNNYSALLALSSNGAPGSFSDGVYLQVSPSNELLICRYADNSLVASFCGNSKCSHFHGNVYPGKDNTWYLGASDSRWKAVYALQTLTSSDIRYKKKIKDLDLSLIDISEAPSFEFYREGMPENETYIGTSAQYWYNILNLKHMYDEITDDYVMDYAPIALCSAISIAKELIPVKSEVKDIKLEIEELRSRVKYLESLIN